MFTYTHVTLIKWHAHTHVPLIKWHAHTHVPLRYNDRPFFGVKEQIVADPEFPTVAYPNPEEGKGALELSFKVCPCDVIVWQSCVSLRRGVTCIDACNR